MGREQVEPTASGPMRWSRATMTSGQAAAELLRRDDAGRDLIAFTKYTFPRYHPAPHHRLIATQLERLLTGDVDRLMLLVPPRHGKSELASRRLPAFYLGRQPDRQFLSVSATADLAADFGRDVRNLISGAEYRSLFGTVLAADSQAKGKWHTSAGGLYRRRCARSRRARDADRRSLRLYGGGAFRDGAQKRVGLVHRHGLQPANAARRNRRHQSPHA
jgi:hypothetical protein